MYENDPHDIPVEDHLGSDEVIECGYCGRPFSSHEARIEKRIYGRGWVFCSEECLANFRDASDYEDENPDIHYPEDPDELSPNMSVKITGPPMHNDD